MPEDERAKRHSSEAIQAREWWQTPLIPVLEAVDLCEFKSILGYTRLNLSKRETEFTHTKVILALRTTHF